MVTKERKMATSEAGGHKTTTMEFIEMYRIFKTEEGRIWKIDTTLIPKEDADHWRERGFLVTREDLTILGVSLL